VFLRIAILLWKKFDFLFLFLRSLFYLHKDFMSYIQSENTSQNRNLNQNFTTNRDVLALPMVDEELIVYDLLTNLAHTQMLKEVGILTPLERKELKKGLLQIKTEFEQKNWKLNPQFEDVHMNVEQYLAVVLNIQAAEKMHTARSRNDQVANDMRLFLRTKSLHFLNHLLACTEAIFTLGLKETETLMPGFTHYQPAMHTTFGHLLAAWGSGFLRQLEKIFFHLQIYNECPLGAAAGFGTGWPIDRKRVAFLLGFERPLENSLDAVTSRLEMEASFLNDCNQVMLIASTMAQDFILYSQPYYGFFTFGEDFVTHSSIMPQKKNLDFAEIIRGKAAFAQGQLLALLSLGKGLPSGYNRDLQMAKSITMDSVRELEFVPCILQAALSTLTVNRKRCLEFCKTGGMNGVDIADFLARNAKMSFREAYFLVKEVVFSQQVENPNWQKDLEQKLKNLGHQLNFQQGDFSSLSNPAYLVNQRKSLGSPQPEGVKDFLNQALEKLASLKNSILAYEQKIETAFNQLWKIED